MPPALLLIVVVTTLWVAYDASQRDWRESSFANAAWKWIVGLLLIWIVVFPLYLFKRRSVPLKP